MICFLPILALKCRPANRPFPRLFKRRIMHKRTVLAVVLLCSALTYGSSISARDAKTHVGERVKVCGEVASTHYALRSHGQPTFINLDQPYPNLIFTIVIWGSDRPKFGDP